jgi:pimeloyl-ACP methyl ester carboxylesterase
MQKASGMAKTVHILPAAARQWHKASSSSLPSTVKLNADVIPSKKTNSQHVVFLHGLYGKGQSFQFLAKARHIQNEFTCHLLDMRNHGSSERHPLMDYESLARDVRSYIAANGLAD